MAQRTVSSSVRREILSWPRHAPRGAVTAFCRDRGISRSEFYKIRRLAEADDPLAGLAAGSRRPRSSPSKTEPGMVQLLLATRRQLQRDGWDYGPLSVGSALRRLGLSPPSRSTIARIFTEAGMVIPEPKKRPRAADKRFVWPRPNDLWQLDGMDWRLADGTVVCVLQLVDDNSRLAPAMLAAPGETSDAAIAVITIGISRCGAPLRLLSDNGSAFNQDRRGRTTRLVTHLRALGIEPMTGSVGHPQTQGKDERFHQTLQRYLDKQAPAATLAALQAQLDTFVDYYNNDRSHQALPGDMTPREAWDERVHAPDPEPPTHPDAPPEPRLRTCTVDNLGRVYLDQVRYQIGSIHAHAIITVLTQDGSHTFFDHRGVELLTHTIPTDDTRYIGITNARRP